MIGLLGTVVTVYLLAWFLNHRIPWLKRLLLPPSLIAGTVLLLLGPQVAGQPGILPLDYYENMQGWAAFLISFLFSAIILEPVHGSRRIGAAVVSQTLYVWLIAILQLAWGYTVVLLFTDTVKDRLFAHIIELSFIGGHGAASAFYAVAEPLGNRAAADLAVAAATAGIFGGLAAGLLLLAFHRTFPEYGKHRFPCSTVDATEPEKPGQSMDFGDEEQSLFLSFLIPFIPVFLAYLIVEAGAQLYAGIRDLPLFFFVIITAHPVKRLLRPVLNLKAIRTFHRLVLEALILSAVATVSLQTIQDNAGLFLLLCAGGFVLAILLHLFAAPRYTPEYPDLALINFGMSTGTTAVGLTLLRSLRQTLPVRPVQIYGLAAPFSGPFIGGGLLSLFVFPGLTVKLPPSAMLLFMLTLAAILVLLLIVLRRLQMR